VSFRKPLYGQYMCSKCTTGAPASRVGVGTLGMIQVIAGSAVTRQVALMALPSANIPARTNGELA